MPRDPNLAFHFLQVRWCTVQHYGVQVDKRIYRATVLVDYIKDKSPYTEHNGRWPIHVNPDDIRQVYFFDLKHTRRWHALVWTEAAVLKGAMNEDGLLFARQLAAANHRVFDDRLALAELLDRRGLTQGRTPAERKAALRLCREQASVLEVDLAAALDVTQLATASRVLVS